MKTKKLLAGVRKMRRLLASPARWTQGVGARDERGLSVPSGSAFAICWCIAGAMDRAFPEGAGQMDLSRLMTSLTSINPGGRETSYVAFNDLNSTTHADVLALLDTAEVFLVEADAPG